MRSSARLTQLHEHPLDLIDGVPSAAASSGFSRQNKARGDQLEASLLNAFRGRRQLGDHVPALPTFGQHALNSLHLSGERRSRFFRSSSTSSGIA